jgi:5-methylcytosine-specific restriction enzyme subunit McrC
MLIYPEVGRSLRLRYRLLGIPVLVSTVDLSKDWRNVEAELQGLLNDCAVAARQPSAQEAQLTTSSLS